MCHQQRFRLRFLLSRVPGRFRLLRDFHRLWCVTAFLLHDGSTISPFVKTSKDHCRCRHFAALWHCQASVAGSQNDRPGSQYLILQLHCFHLVLFLDTFSWRIFFHKVLPQQGRWSLRKVLTSYHPVCIWHFASCDRITFFQFLPVILLGQDRRRRKQPRGRRHWTAGACVALVKSLWERL